MKVQEIMIRTVKSCSPETDLAAAATMMWDGDCGVVPVVSAEGKVSGVITDRDICIAVATKHRRAEEITVGEVLKESLGGSVGWNLFTCYPDDDLSSALRAMRNHRVRRLPVINKEGKLLGIVSINDVILAAQDAKSRKGAGPSYDEIIETFKAICEHRPRAAAA